jgi:hypothetical protein
VVEGIREDVQTKFGADKLRNFHNGQKMPLLVCFVNFMSEPGMLGLIEERRSAPDGRQFQSIMKFFTCFLIVPLLTLKREPIAEYGPEPCLPSRNVRHARTYCSTTQVLDTNPSSASRTSASSDNSGLPCRESARTDGPSIINDNSKRP